MSIQLLFFSLLNLISLFYHFTSFQKHTHTHTAEANEGVGTGEGLTVGGPGGSGAGPRLVPGPNPQCHRETAAGWPELQRHGQYRT